MIQSGPITKNGVLSVTTLSVKKKPELILVGENY